MADDSCQRKRKAQVIIIGAGLGGISTGIALKRQLGFENFTIYEKAATIGGTWRDNTYPGCGSDVPGHFYSLSTELNPYWPSYYVNQPVILQYWQDLYDKHNISAHTVFNTEVISAEWDITIQCYHVTLLNTETGVKTQTEGEVVIWALGGLMSPVFPKDIPGANKFRGVAWHSARWRHEVDLSGKRIGVIGNGCSAAQFIPEISKDPSLQVINFCRTPQWYVPKAQYEYPSWAKWIFVKVPLAMRTYRNLIMATSEFGYLTFMKTNTLIVKVVRTMTRYIKHNAPEKYHDRLIPTYAPGCKRIIVDPGYLSSLQQPNVDLSWEAIDEIIEEGIKLKSGEVVPLDIIIFGTGYSIDSAEITIRGRTGATLREYFDSQNGPAAYLGTCMPGYPNFFTLTGPNVATGHASLVFCNEVQIQYALQMIKPVIEETAASFEIQHEATEAYNIWLQKRLARSVWTDCRSYYHTGGEQKGKIIATFPGTLTLFWWLARKPRWEHFRAIGAERWETQQKRASARSRGLGVLFVVLVCVSLMIKYPPTQFKLIDIRDLWLRLAVRFHLGLTGFTG